MLTANEMQACLQAKIIIDCWITFHHLFSDMVEQAVVSTLNRDKDKIFISYYLNNVHEKLMSYVTCNVLAMYA